MRMIPPFAARYPHFSSRPLPGLLRHLPERDRRLDPAGPGDAELRQQTLDAAPSFADEDAAQDVLVLSRILPDHEDSRRPVEPAAVEDRAPLDAKILERVGRLVRVTALALRPASTPA
jgi:hypothetical protein